MTIMIRMVRIMTMSKDYDIMVVIFMVYDYESLSL